MSNCCANSASVLSPRTAAKATFALKAGVWFRRGRFVMVSPVRHTSWPLSGRNSTYPAVQISKASSVLENVELAGVIRHDDGVGEQAAGDNRPDHGGLGDPPATAGTQAETVQMGLPGIFVGKAPALVAEQAGDHSLGNLVLDQVGRGAGVDDVVGMAGAQQVQEVQPALRRTGGEPGEAVIADVRGVFVMSGMAGAGVIDRHPPGRRQSRLQKGVLLGVESILVGRQDGDELALRD